MLNADRASGVVDARIGGGDDALGAVTVAVVCDLNPVRCTVGSMLLVFVRLRMLK
jgi:hypothetical protein